MTGKALDGAKGTPLRQRMIEQMRIANLAESTQSAVRYNELPQHSSIDQKALLCLACASGPPCRPWRK